MLFAKRQLQTTKWKIGTYIAKLPEEFRARFEHLQE